MNQSYTKRLLIIVFLIAIVSLTIVLRTNDLFEGSQERVVIHYVNTTEQNYVYVTTCANQTNINTFVYKSLPPLQDALDAFDWDSVEKAFDEQRKLHPSGNIYLPTDLYESYLNVLVPYLEQQVRPDFVMLIHKAKLSNRS